jgi:LysM repeat protein
MTLLLPPTPHIATYTVVAGDTLSQLAVEGSTTVVALVTASDVADPNEISVGQVLALPEGVHIAVHAAVAAPTYHAQVTASGTPTSSYSPPTTHYSGSGLGACISYAESRDQAQVTNSTGHYGLYQYSFQTWVANGGAPSAFGNASAATQTQVFNNTVAHYGYAPWAGDPCVG